MDYGWNFTLSFKCHINVDEILGLYMYICSFVFTCLDINTIFFFGFSSRYSSEPSKFNRIPQSSELDGDLLRRNS